MNIGIVGCGNVSDIYFQNCKRFEWLKVVACADLDLGRARAKAEQHGVSRWCSTSELISASEVEVILNLTRPATHFEIALKALEAGKHIYNEKPLAITRADGQKLIEAARRKILRIGCAPDTFMGAGLQTGRKAIDAGAIGQPVGAFGVMMYPGHESWHPDPEFFYQAGGGPLFDMGPYYLTALVSLLGPVRRVTSSAKTTKNERVVGSGPKKDQRFPVSVPTHVAAVLDFECGAVATLMMSFDVWYHELPILEIYGTEGSMSLPDPNQFGGAVRLRKARTENWAPVPSRHGYEENSRSLGLADMALAVKTGHPHRASGELAFHILEIMQALHEASRESCHIDIISRCERPEAMKEGLKFGEV
jgi:predicted dehydrogenase